MDKKTANKLVALANKLDEKGYTDIAEEIDSVIRVIAQANEPMEAEPVEPMEATPVVEPEEAELIEEPTKPLSTEEVKLLILGKLDRLFTGPVNKAGIIYFLRNLITELQKTPMRSGVSRLMPGQVGRQLKEIRREQM